MRGEDRELAKTVSLDRGARPEPQERIHRAGDRWMEFTEIAGLDKAVARRIRSEFRTL